MKYARLLCVVLTLLGCANAPVDRTELGSDALIADVWRQTRAFFDLPIETKLEVLRTRDNPWGFYHNELTKNQRDKKQVFDFTRPGVDPLLNSLLLSRARI